MAKLKIKKNNTTSETPKVKLFNPYQPDYQHELLNKTVIDLRSIEGFDELSDVQQRFLYRLSINNLKEAFTLMESGTKRTEYRSWVSHDALFMDVLSHIKSVHYDSLEEIDYQTAHYAMQGATRKRVFQRKVDPVKEVGHGNNGSGGTSINAIFMGDEVSNRGLAAMKDVVKAMKDRGMSLDKLTPDQSRQKISLRSDGVSQR